MPYRITEPHPSVPSSHYLYAGRGGAGNYVHVDPLTTTRGSDATGPASMASLPAAPTTYYLTGRGGAGNARSSSSRERAIFSFDEELEHQRRMTEHQAPVYHIGRGGSGNLVDEQGRSVRSAASVGGGKRSGSDAGSEVSADSARSRMGAAWGKVRSLSKH